MTSQRLTKYLVKLNASKTIVVCHTIFSQFKGNVSSGGIDVCLRALCGDLFGCRC